MRRQRRRKTTSSVWCLGLFIWMALKWSGGEWFWKCGSGFRDAVTQLPTRRTIVLIQNHASAWRPKRLKDCGCSATPGPLAIETTRPKWNGLVVAGYRSGRRLLFDPQHCHRSRESYRRFLALSSGLDFAGRCILALKYRVSHAATKDRAQLQVYTRPLQLQSWRSVASHI